MPMESKASKQFYSSHFCKVLCYGVLGRYLREPSLPGFSHSVDEAWWTIDGVIGLHRVREREVAVRGRGFEH